ncbi:MAG: hypothetical protein F6K19_50975, partial [Cyanothece sp. SIO1E1]|nr:hypothetical protein [Cyanothece sp. SIO1E1]
QGVLLFSIFQLGQGSPRLRFKSQEFSFILTGLLVGCLVLLPYALKTSAYGPVVTAVEARVMPEFLPGGTTFFFADNPIQYWLGERSGLFPGFDPATILTGFLLPFLFLFRARLPLLKYLTPAAWLLVRLLGASLLLFVVSHTVLFRLHLPSRYTQHSFRIILAIAAAITLMTIFDAVLHWALASSQSRQARQAIASLVAFIVLSSIVLYPCSLSSFLDLEYRGGEHPRLYQFFREQPKDIRVASLSNEANNIATFAQRSALVSPIHGVSFHTGYYQQFRQRVVDLFRAQLSDDPTVLTDTIHSYQITHWLLDKHSFDFNSMADNDWLQQFQPESAEAMTQLSQGKVPLLITLKSECTVFEHEDNVVLDANCLVQQLSLQ